MVNTLGEARGNAAWERVWSQLSPLSCATLASSLTEGERFFAGMSRFDSFGELVFSSSLSSAS